MSDDRRCANSVRWTCSTLLDSVATLSSPAHDTHSCRGCRPQAFEPRGGGLQRGTSRMFVLYLFFCRELPKVLYGYPIVQRMCVGYL